MSIFGGYMKTLIAIYILSITSVQAATIYAPPTAGNFDLRQWKITLPTADNSRRATEIMPDQIMTGYANKYFYLDNNAKMTFWAPVNGANLATTDNSSYPRSELREMIGDNDRDDWNWEGHHTLQACLWVSQTSASQKVIVGQIHSYNEPLVKLQWYKGDVYAQIKRQENGSNGEIKTKLASPGASKFCYTIDSNAGVVNVSVRGGNTATYDYVGTDPNWMKQKFYFKAGSYCQEKIGADATPNAGCKVRFQSLTSAH
jgi:hypothetical protein